jgi:uncharacterized protein YpbB
MAKKGTGKIDPVLLRELLAKEVPQTDIAKRFGVSDGAITHAKKQLQRQMTRVVALEKAGEVVQHDLDLIQELKNLNRVLNQQLDDALQRVNTTGKAVEKAAVQKIIVDLAGELRKQIDTAVKVGEFWYSHNEFVQFRETVLDVLDECKPGLRRQIIEKLKKKHVLRDSARLPG